MGRDEGLVVARDPEETVNNLREDDEGEAPGDLGPRPAPHQKIGDGIGHAELDQDVLEAEGDAARTDAVERPTEEKESERADDDMTRDQGPGIAALLAPGHGKGQGHADEEHKKRLHEVPGTQPGPG